MRFARTSVALTLTFAIVACNERKEEPKKPVGSSAPVAPAPTPVVAPEKILVGHVGSMTGNEATFGTSTDNGLKLAIEEQNKKGGIKGKLIALKTLDDQGRPEEASVAATRLVTLDKVAILFGEVASSRSMAMAPIADTNQVPQISIASTNPKVTKDGDKTRPYVFRVCFIDPFQGTVMAKFASENLKFNNVAVLRDVGNDYSVGLADFFIKAFTSAGRQDSG